jgi:hypothetical protein
MSTAAVASAIAEDYCKAFSSCCVGAGQPPIDVARCRELTSAAAQKELDAAGTVDISAKDATVCVDAIHARIAACGGDDIHWPGADPALFAPASIATACLPLLPNVKVPTVEHCSDSMHCQEPGTTCAIDMCTSAGLIGLGCPAGECVDSARCVTGTCVALSTADVNAKCATNDDCRLGLVCFENLCAPAREHPDVSSQRSSPYRIGADTCRAFTYL